MLVIELICMAKSRISYNANLPLQQGTDWKVLETSCTASMYCEDQLEVVTSYNQDLILGRIQGTLLGLYKLGRGCL